MLSPPVLAWLGVPLVTIVEGALQPIIACGDFEVSTMQENVTGKQTPKIVEQRWEGRSTAGFRNQKCFANSRKPGPSCLGRERFHLLQALSIFFPKRVGADKRHLLLTPGSFKLRPTTPLTAAWEHNSLF